MEKEKSLVKTLFGDVLSPMDFSSLWDLKKQSLFDFNGFVDLGDKYQLNVQLPIVGDSISINVEDNKVTISYNEKEENFSSSGSYTYSLPEDIDISTIKADVGKKKKKVLTITGNKMKKQTRNLKINVK